jgi:hypothetical protein
VLHLGLVGVGYQYSIRIWESSEWQTRLASHGPERLFATALHVVLGAALVVAHSLEESLS